MAQVVGGLQSNARVLMFNNYTYHRHYRTKTLRTIVWRCSQYKTACKARLRTGDVDLDVDQPHVEVLEVSRLLKYLRLVRFFGT